MIRTIVQNINALQSQLPTYGQNLIEAHRVLLLELAWLSYIAFTILGHPFIGVSVLLSGIPLCGFATWVCGGKVGLLTIALSLPYNMLVMTYNLNQPQGWRIAMEPGGVAAQLIIVLLVTLAKRNHKKARKLTATLERKIQQRNDELQEITEYIINQSQAERLRMSNQLCNTVACQLSDLLILGESLIKSLAETNSPYIDDADKLTKIIFQSIEQIKTLTHKLSSQNILEAGIEHALCDMCTYLTETTNTHFIINTTGPLAEIPNKMTLNIYRIAHEAVTNALRHGKATTIDLALKLEGDSCALEVINDGSPIAKNQNEGLGMRLIQQRAEMINATISLETTHTGKTRFACIVPL